MINNLRSRAEREPAGRLLNELYAATGYEEWLVATHDKREAKARTQSVRDLIDWLSRKGESDNRNLLELTQMVALITMLEGRDGEGIDAVHLSTLHAAKGLEFPHVFLVGPGGGAAAPSRIGGARDDRRGTPAHVRRHHARATDRCTCRIAGGASAPAK